MQKRVVQRQKSSDGLPFTRQDDTSFVATRAEPSRGSSRGREHRRWMRQQPNSQIMACIIFALGIFVGIIVLVAEHISPIHTHKHLALSQFASLEVAFSSSSLVLLYFAAAWCPVSTPVTQNIEDYLSDYLAPPPSKTSSRTKTYPLSLVYVSSDRTMEDFENYLGTNWMVVPWDSSERSELKRHFRVCAKPEVESLGIDRTMEIPTLLILDSTTRTVVTTSGVQDLKEYGDHALGHWLDLQNLMRAMEDKYQQEDDEPLMERRTLDTNHHHMDAYSSLFH